jgi:hypothetical protein
MASALSKSSSSSPGKNRTALAPGVVESGRRSIVTGSDGWGMNGGGASAFSAAGFGVMIGFDATAGLAIPALAATGFGAGRSSGLARAPASSFPASFGREDAGAGSKLGSESLSVTVLFSAGLLSVGTASAGAAA